MAADPHHTQPVLAAGAPLFNAKGALILLHGRGGAAQQMLSLGESFGQAELALLAPQAAGGTWYPYSFLAPREENEPYLTSALRKVSAVLHTAVEAGFSADRIALCGFSQGACLATEYVGRNPQRYGGLIAFTGGLIGPLEEEIELTGDLAGTPVLLSSGDPDPHVPWSRVQQSANLLTTIGGVVTLKRFPGRAHTIGAQEIELARELLQAAPAMT